MATRAERKRRSSTRAAAKGAERARAREEAGFVPRPKPAERRNERHISGLDWLRSKDKISRREHAAGERYGKDYRTSRLEGASLIQSCLAEKFPGGGNPGRITIIDSTAVEWRAHAVDDLREAQAALSWHSGMIAVCDLVCGQQLTPREALGEGAKDREVEEAVNGLRIALQILATHWRIN